MSGINQKNTTGANDETVTQLADGQDEATPIVKQKVAVDNNGSNRAYGDVQITGYDGVHQADVLLVDGQRRLQTSATATVESLFGEAVFPFTAIKILDIGSNGDTIRVQIPDDSVDVTTTKTASETTDNDLAKLVADDLNADGTFSALYEAEVPRDSNIVCIQALLVQTLREDSGDVIATPSGGISLTLVWDTIKDQSLALALFPHPRDCTKGTINVTGQIGVIETGRPPQRILLHTAGGSEDMGVDGSVTPVEFRLSNNTEYDGTQDFIVTELRIEATANTISNTFSKYIGVNVLINGHTVQIRSGGVLDYDEDLLRVPDIFHAFAIGSGSRFQLEVGSGDDSLVAVFSRPFVIDKVGTHATADDIIVTVNDDLSSSSIKRLQMSVVGFSEDQL